MSLTEGDAPGADRVLVLVGVEAGVYDLAEDLVHDLGEALGVEHAVQGADEYGRLGVDLGRQHARLVLRHVARVLLIPRYHFHLLGLAPLRLLLLLLLLMLLSSLLRGGRIGGGGGGGERTGRNDDCVVVVFAAVLLLLAAVEQHALHGRLVLVYDVDVAGRAALLRLAYGRDARMLGILARYLQLHRSVLVQRLDERLLVDVPRQAAEEHLARVQRVLRVDLGRQPARPHLVRRLLTRRRRRHVALGALLLMLLLLLLLQLLLFAGRGG